MKLLACHQTRQRTATCQRSPWQASKHCYVMEKEQYRTYLMLLLSLEHTPIRHCNARLRRYARKNAPDYYLSAEHHRVSSYCTNVLYDRESVMASGLFDQPTRRTERLSLRIEPQLLAQFETLARQHDLSASELIRRSMRAAVNAAERQQKASEYGRTKKDA